MSRFVHYYSTFNGLRGQWGGLPPWARMIVVICALPGLALALLSILALGVSILALLLLTVPVYRLLSAVTSGSSASPETSDEAGNYVSSGRRHVDVKVIEPDNH